MNQHDRCKDDDDLPQMDGTCDACEPDEAQPAIQMCVVCRFAFCVVHAEKHTRSTRHPLQPYSPPDPGANANADINAQPEADANRLEEAEAAEGGAEGVEGQDEEQSGCESGKRDTVTVERLRCKEHGQEGSLYCKQDEKIVCVLCAVQGDHREHEIITLQEAYMWQKGKEGIDLLACTQEMSEKIKTKWTSPDMSPEELECYVNQQFDELQRLVRQEEWRVLHLVDLKEAFLTAHAAEKIAEISVHTEKLQEEMDSITQQLGELDHAEQNGVAPANLAPLLAGQNRPPGVALLEERPLGHRKKEGRKEGLSKSREAYEGQWCKHSGHTQFCRQEDLPHTLTDGWTLKPDQGSVGHYK
ncbi:tripartite motif-containing protein 44 isoform X2 [Tachysurus fulvidraco]|uniref:tripartite motif-containing protein 44 isoform X2 n=1 Tax=Tachysurus fulvidraco TaxID=1234273 RepID=UPI000F4F2659|nr:tripartite motif-containing protein 44 isoform X2 [Tachysurus fulvidraco]